MPQINPEFILEQLNSDWRLSEAQDCLIRDFNLTNFEQALALANQIGQLAEKHHHHPNLKLGWGYLEVCLTTHDIQAISEKDLALAKAIDKLCF